MKTNKARKVSSPLIQGLLRGITPAEKAQLDAKMRLAARIEDLMYAQGWNKSTFASKLGKRPSEITKWLSGTHNFTVETLVEIGRCFGLRLQDLFVGAAERMSYGSSSRVQIRTGHSAIPFPAIIHRRATGATAWVGGGSMASLSKTEKN